MAFDGTKPHKGPSFFAKAGNERKAEALRLGVFDLDEGGRAEPAAPQTS
jgi:hypothetical protein